MHLQVLYGLTDKVAKAMKKICCRPWPIIFVHPRVV